MAWKQRSFHTIFRDKLHCQLHLSEMPSKGCAHPGCSNSRKGKGIIIFKVSLTINEFGIATSQMLCHVLG